MKAYLDIVRRILAEGERKANRTGVDTLAIAGAMFEHDVSIQVEPGHAGDESLRKSGIALRDLPNLRARLAEMFSRTEQSRALLGHTLDHLEAASAEAPLYVLQARLAALQAASDVTDLAMKACGGAAFSRHLGLERVFRDARAGWVMAPTVDHLLEFSGRALTGLPLFE